MCAIEMSSIDPTIEVPSEEPRFEMLRDKPERARSNGGKVLSQFSWFAGSGSTLPVENDTDLYIMPRVIKRN